MLEGKTLPAFEILEKRAAGLSCAGARTELRAAYRGPLTCIQLQTYNRRLP